MTLADIDWILEAFVGGPQFDVVLRRLKGEYKIDFLFEPVDVQTARWVSSNDEKRFDEFQKRAAQNLAYDHAGELVYIAPTRVNLKMAQEKWPEVEFHATREHGVDIR